MTASWSRSDAIRDASDMRAARADDMRAEATGHADDWADDERPTLRELDVDEWHAERYRSWTDEH